MLILNVSSVCSVRSVSLRVNSSVHYALCSLMLCFPSVFNDSWLCAYLGFEVPVTQSMDNVPQHCVGGITVGKEKADGKCAITQCPFFLLPCLSSPSAHVCMMEADTSGEDGLGE